MIKKVTDKLISLAGNSDTEVSIAAIYALGEGADATDATTKKLLMLVENNDPLIKTAAIKALGRLYRHKKG